MPAIDHIHAREIFDSRGRPTVEVEVTCGGALGRASVPSGASTGRFEARELRDGDRTRLDGRGVRRAVGHVRDEIARSLIGCDADDQQAIDRRLCELDGTSNKSRLGANAVLGTSLAAAHAAAAAQGRTLADHMQSLWGRVTASMSGPGPARPAGHSAGADLRLPGLGQRPLLPLPMVNMISGGLHAGGNLDIQDFLVLPVGAHSFEEALEWVIAAYHRLGEVLIHRGFEGRLVGDEGGYGPRLGSHEQALEILVETIEAAGFDPGTQLAIGLDVAATHFACEDGYRLTIEGGRVCPTDRWIDTLETWIERFPVVSIEDPLAEDDWAGWKTITDRLGGRVQLIGDDLFVTQAARLRRGIDAGVANSVLIKLNQVGTLSETLETLRLALDAGYRPVVSARSGETEDTTIADLAVATGAGQIKIGSVARGERLVKYNQLLRLAEQPGERVGWLGGAVLSRRR